MKGKKLGLAAASVLVAAALGELGIRLAVPVRNVGPAFSVFDAVYGKRLKAGFRGERTTPEFRMRLTTNSLGFRGPEPASFPRRAVLFLGDSFTLGYGVHDGEEYPEVVRRALALPVVNAGIGNTGNGRWVKFLRREAPRYDPRCVVLQISANDFADNQAERLFELTPAGDLAELTPPQEPVARAVQTVIDGIPGLSYSYLVGLAQQATSRPRPEPRAGTDRLTWRLLEEALRLCRDHRWPVLGLSADLEGERLAQAEALFGRYDAPLLRAPRRTERPDLYYRVDGHWNAAGHAHVARLLAPRLRE